MTTELARLSPGEGAAGPGSPSKAPALRSWARESGGHPAWRPPLSDKLPSGPVTEQGLSRLLSRQDGEPPASVPGRSHSPGPSCPHWRAISLLEGEPSYLSPGAYVGTSVHSKPLTPSRWCEKPACRPRRAALSGGASRARGHALCPLPNAGAGGHARPFRFKLMTLK